MKFAVTVALPANVYLVAGVVVLENAPLVAVHSESIHPLAGLAVRSTVEPWRYPVKEAQLTGVLTIAVPAPVGFTLIVRSSHVLLC